MGVEPTWDRLTAPPGFEVRSLHRERDSSVDVFRQFGRKQLDARRIDPPQVLATNGEPVLSSRSRKSAAVKRPSGADAAISMAMPAIRSTTGLVKK